MNETTEQARAQANASDALRQQLDQAIGDYNFALGRKYAYPSTVQLLDDVTKILPDDTWLTQFEVKSVPKGKDPHRDILLRGESGNAGRLVSALEESKLVEQAAPRSPTTKIQPGPGEVFDLGAQLKPLPLPEPIQLASVPRAARAKGDAAAAPPQAPAAPAPAAAAAPAAATPAPARPPPARCACRRGGRPASGRDDARRTGRGGACRHRPRPAASASPFRHGAAPAAVARADGAAAGQRPAVRGIADGAASRRHHVSRPAPGGIGARARRRPADAPAAAPAEAPAAAPDEAEE